MVSGSCTACRPSSWTRSPRRRQRSCFPARHRIFADRGYSDKFWLIESGYVDLDVRVPGEGPAVIATVGIGGPLGWSWLIESHEWAFGGRAAA
jgi:hypothetical protein